MNDSHSNPEQRLNLAALLRAAADDELTSPDERRLEAFLDEDPSLASRIESERLMRRAIGRALEREAGDAAPPGLRDRVARAMASADLGAPGSVSVPEAMARSTRSPGFWQRTNFRVGLAAAIVLIGITLTFFNTGTPLGPNQALADRTAAASYVASEHGHCVTDIAHAARKLVLQNPDDLPTLAGGVVGTEIALADLVASGATDIRFIDAGECHVPGGGPSMHLRFTLPDIEGDVSLFLQRDSGRMKLAEGYTYLMVPGEDAPKTPSVYIWLREGIIYFLVVPERAGCEQLRESLVLPTETRSLTDRV